MKESQVKDDGDEQFAFASSVGSLREFEERSAITWAPENSYIRLKPRFLFAFTSSVSSLCEYDERVPTNWALEHSHGFV